MLHKAMYSVPSYVGPYLNSKLLKCNHSLAQKQWELLWDQNGVN